MNLKRLFSWQVAQQYQSDNKPLEATAEVTANTPTKNVVYLNAQEQHDELGINPNIEVTKTQAPITGQGLMYEVELQAFFNQNYFGLGQHNGAVLKSLEAYQLGRSELIAKFQNSCSGILERKQSRINKLESEVIAIEGLSPPMTARLELACTHLAREISQLETQQSLATEGKGWVLEALNRYQIGFQKGMREAVEFELLSC
jgi:hypothetical protein